MFFFQIATFQTKFSKKGKFFPRFWPYKNMIIILFIHRFDAWLKGRQHEK